MRAQLERRAAAVRALCKRRAAQLDDCVRFFRLKRDVDEFLAWIDDKIRQSGQMATKTSGNNNSKAGNVDI